MGPRCELRVSGIKEAEIPENVERFSGFLASLIYAPS